MFSLFWVVTQHMLVVVTAAAAVKNYHNMLCHNPEKPRPHLHSSRSLKSRMICLIFTEYARLLCTTDTNYNVVISAYVPFLKRQGSIGIILKNSKKRGTLQRNSALWSMLMTDKRKHSITKNKNYGLTIWSFFKKRYTCYKLSCDKNLEGCELNTLERICCTRTDLCYGFISTEFKNNGAYT